MARSTVFWNAVRADEIDLPVADDGEREAGNVALLQEARDERVERRGEAGLARRRERARGERASEADRQAKREREEAASAHVSPVYVGRIG